MPTASASRPSQAAFRRTDSTLCWTVRSVPTQWCSYKSIENQSNFFPPGFSRTTIKNLEKVFNFNGLFFRSEILRQRFDEPHQKEGTFKALVEEIPVVLEIVPGQVPAKFTGRYWRDDKDCVLWSHFIRHGKREHLSNKRINKLFWNKNKRNKTANFFEDFFVLDCAQCASNTILFFV